MISCVDLYYDFMGSCYGFFLYNLLNVDRSKHHKIQDAKCS